ncbi:glycosyltransferase family 1 protein [uncultured Clostridium sp.]|uniref:glycosyltransferase family 4 protein n=1 Tax=uncultured Clostridium sp. TaxID=59620 RepID=UPI0025E4CC44|nr:glycosyltransferase family 1 protein [uncultured Clostridium sp.]
MKIAIDARGADLYNGTGIGTYTFNLINNMINLNSSNKFMLFCSGSLNKNFNKSNTEILFSSGHHGTFYEKYYFPSKIKNSNIDLYHIPQNGIGFNYDVDIPTVVTIHDLIPYIMPETVGKGYLERFLRDMPNIIRKSAAILTVSEYSKKDILKFFSFYPENQIYVTPLATNSKFKPLDKIQSKSYVQKKYSFTTPYILYIGGFSQRKNTAGLIKAFNNCYNSLNKSYTLLLGGSLKDEGLQLYDYVKANNLSDKIKFCGYLDEDILPILYSGCEAFIYPSFYEGFGLPPLEAMSCAAPVITSNITSIPEVTNDSAILINPYSQLELEKALVRLLNDEILKKELSEKGYNNSLKFSWKNTAEKTLNIYQDIINSLSV